MTLPVSADIPLSSPIDASRPVGTVGRMLLADLTGEMSLLHVQGPAADWLARTLGGVPVAPGGVIVRDESIAACLRPDLFLLLAASVGTDELPPGVTLTDLTHGRGLLRLSGSQAGRVLAKLCGLNLHDSAFPDRHVAPASYARVRAIVLRHDGAADGSPAYYLIVDRSHAAYVWAVTVDAMQEYLKA